MPIRLSGMNSGLDTDSIVTELVKAKSEKKNKLIKAQTKLEWKQDAWKELNSKVYALYSKTLSNMRLSSDYAKRTTKLSDPTAASIITGSNAVKGTQTLQVEELAATAYLTGDEIKMNNGSDKVTSATKLSDLQSVVINGSEKLKVKIGSEEKELTVDQNTTIADVTKWLNEAGLNASFDEKNQRFFVSAKESGSAGDFTIANSSGDLLKSLGLDTAQLGNGAKMNGTDAKIILNGAVFTSSSNTFEINGLTITATAKTANPITITTDDDTQGIYDMVKNFFKEYNAVINEMDSLYNADSSKGYEPLTDDEKEAMSEKEIEKWEEKIKSSILRKDSTLSTVASAMKQIMLQGVEMSDGSRMYLSEFGINTLGYFNAAENERNAYHIDGDTDDSSVSANADKLKTAIANNPEQVTEFFMQLSRNLYEKLGDLMKGTEYSSAFTLYDDKAMKSEYDGYKDKIAKQEKLIAAYEDRYYKQFTRMETALAKLQSKESALSGLFGS
ncbi:MAG: flagellar filament capping protein FliD [Lachnospiraceae bacterium]